MLAAEAIVEGTDVKLKSDLKVMVSFDAVLRLSLENRELKNARSISDMNADLNGPVLTLVCTAIERP